MKVNEIIKPPSLSLQLEGKSNQAIIEKNKEKVEEIKKEQININKEKEIDILI